MLPIIKQTPDEIADAFKKHVRQLVGFNSKTWRETQGYGVSNSPFPYPIMERAQLALFNLGSIESGENEAEYSVRDNHNAILIETAARFISGMEVYLAFVIQKKYDDFFERLRKMTRQVSKGYSKSNNNARIVYSLSNKKFYLFNSELWMTADLDDSAHLEPLISVDKLFFAIYPSDKPLYQSLSAGEFVHFIRSLNIPEIQEVSPWRGEGTVITDEMRRMPLSVPLQEIRMTIEGMGLNYEEDYIGRLHTALNYHARKHFVILTGLSGTGKTSLAISYANATHGIKVFSPDDPLLFVCPVRPEWTDPSGLTGYYDVLSGKYYVPKFLEAVYAAITYSSSPVFVCFDEMNLARVEYYLSDILSAMETGKGLDLHTSLYPITGTNGGVISSRIQEFPKNLYIVGTVNIDETTNPLSDKVLDRAIVIDTTKVDINKKLNLMLLDASVSHTSVEACRKILNDVYKILEPHNLQFGYRITEEFVKYYHLAVEQFKEDSENTIDNLLTQKVLVKLRGDSRQQEMLTNLKKLFASDYPKSLKKITDLIKELEDLGSFQYAR